MNSPPLPIANQPSIQQSIHTVKTLLADGEIILCTTLNDDSATCPDDETPVLLRTIVQLDADVITKVSESFFQLGEKKEAALLASHYHKVSQEIKAVQNVRIAIKTIAWTLIGGITAIPFINWLMHLYYDPLQLLDYRHLQPVLSGLTFQGMKKLLGFTIQKYIQKKMGL